VKQALKAQGFGTLTEIDVQATLKDKLGKDMEPYVILGTCNPQLAHRALGVDREIGLLLPCNVVVRDTGSGTAGAGPRPADHGHRAGRDELQPSAEEASRRLQSAPDDLRA
jgi:uncharacterized protein (DUF302 family)